MNIYLCLKNKIRANKIVLNLILLKIGLVQFVQSIFVGL